MTTLLATDGYKFSMAEAGAALRTETFYYSHRRGGINGWHYMPVDVEAFIRENLPKPAKQAEYDFLSLHSYDIGAAVRKALSLTSAVKVKAVPKGSWFYNHEPAFSATGPSALVSWPEPMVLQLHYRIQIATLFMSGFHDELASKIASVTCEQEKEIILETLDSLQTDCGSVIKARPQFEINVRSEEYYEFVSKKARDLIALVENPARLFEVGMRGVSCSAQHEIALRAIKDAGILRTSNVELARKLQMIPIGTMGHEHPQRFGLDDYAAFSAMRDRFAGFLFYLPDTISTLLSGIPSALQVIGETPDRDAGIRFDSEKNARSHYTYAVALAREMGLNPRLAFESGWNYDLTKEFEELRREVRWEADRQAYGYGGYLTAPSWPSVQRDDVSAVWKLSKSGTMPTMKFGDEPNSGKQSLPGDVVVWRVSPRAGSSSTPISILAQEDEKLGLAPFYKLTGLDQDPCLSPFHRTLPRAPVQLSPETLELVAGCQQRRKEVIARVAERL
jgi:nicotinate phosphoribosyltransferase